ncbi:hypothetical protein HYT32_01835 [Candidatus Roizmanbacteria bacterium]|nr:hypothetical protein [Candidatus Roizmanbacteria bacterium]
MDPEEYRKKIERDILSIIEEKLRNGQMDATRAKVIARAVLDKLHPPLTLDQIYKTVSILDNNFKELASALLPVIKEHDDQVKNIIALHAEKLIREGNFNEAEKVLKKATKEEV